MSPASVTVVAETCMAADAWATALMVRGSLDGAVLARTLGLDALFLDRDGSGFRRTAVGRLFTAAAAGTGHEPRGSSPAQPSLRGPIHAGTAV
jgi:thiamine biosynthesis lipoprotein